ncbi:MAG: TatD family hydrolase [Armatimonadetes bacterium]|nr:TatD family hydrolase [Armatimonadota bacterium]
MRLTDTHCHLNDGRAFPVPEATVAEAAESGVWRLVVVGVDSESSRRAVEIAEGCDQVYAVVGWHPNYTSDYREGSLKEVRELLDHPKCVALGEIGLDFYRDHASRDDQHRALREQLDLAEDKGVPVVFHCRDAYPELLSVLEGRKGLPYLFHCFAGSDDDAARASGLGSWFGVDGPLTYASAGPLREVVARLPKDKIVLETDSPYMTPVPYRGQRNRPSFLPYVNAALAECWGVTVEECAAQTEANAEAFFGF